jgi:hypothetical protein
VYFLLELPLLVKSTTRKTMNSTNAPRLRQLILKLHQSCMQKALHRDYKLL